MYHPVSSRSSLRRVVVPLVVSACFSVAGCGGSEGTAEPNLDLQPAGSVLVMEASPQASPLGQMLDIDSSSRFTVTEIRVGGDDYGPWLEVDVRGEAAKDAGFLPYAIAIRCTSSAETGGWQADSTVSPGQEIPKGAYLEGTFNLLLPGDGRYGEPVPECTPPAFIEVGSSPSGWFAIPAQLVDQLNKTAEEFNVALEAP